MPSWTDRNFFALVTTNVLILKYGSLVIPPLLCFCQFLSACYLVINSSLSSSASPLTLNFVRSPQSCPPFTIPSTVSLITSPCLICLLCPSIYLPPPTYSFFKATHIPYLCHLIRALSLYVKDPILTLTREHAVEGHKKKQERGKPWINQSLNWPTAD